jgi:hypothetical protein
MQIEWVWSPQSDRMQSGHAMNIFWSQRAQIKSRSTILKKKAFRQLHNPQFNYLKAIYTSWMEGKGEMKQKKRCFVGRCYLWKICTNQKTR